MPNYRALEDLNHAPKLAEALGNMVVAWAHAEMILFCTFARIAGIGGNMAMESFAQIPTFESRIRFTRALLGQWETKKYDKDAIDKAISKLAKLASTRNHWIHGDWCANKDKTITVIFDHRAPITSKARRKPVKAQDVKTHCEAVKKRADALGALIDWEKVGP